MKTLDDRDQADSVILKELTAAGIPIVEATPAEMNPQCNDVSFTIVGQVGNCRLQRSGAYWVANGLVPLEVAREIYADPIGKKYVRAGGHCGCEPPEEHASWYNSEGWKLLEKKELEKAIKKYGKDSIVVRYFKEAEGVLFSDDLARDGKQYVTLYHIDSIGGLALFARHVSQVKK